jgi:hypothetical protein
MRDGDSMSSDNISDPLNYRAIFKLVGKDNHSASFDSSILFDRLMHINEFKSAGKSLRILSLVRI